MAIYRLEKKSISRGSNHNLVAAIAYRCGAKLVDHNKLNPKAQVHDYTKKTDVVCSEIIAPNSLSQQLTEAGIQLTLEQVANLVEQNEITKRGKMKTVAKLANEYVLAGSYELSQAENIQAFQTFAKKQAEEQDVIAMVFVHDPKQGHDANSDLQTADNSTVKDLRNIHAHVVLLSRKVLISNGRLQLGSKSDSELSDTDRKNKGLVPSKIWLKEVREQWANIQNKSLAQHGIAPITHKSYKDLGLNLKPTKHLGKHASAMMRKGIQTHLGTQNDSICTYNHTYIEHSTSCVDNTEEQELNIRERRIATVRRKTELSERWFAAVSERVGRSKQSALFTERRVEKSKREIIELERRVKGIGDSNWRERAIEELDKQTAIFDRETKQAAKRLRTFRP